MRGQKGFVLLTTLVFAEVMSLFLLTSLRQSVVSIKALNLLTQNDKLYYQAQAIMRRLIIKVRLRKVSHCVTDKPLSHDALLKKNNDFFCRDTFDQQVFRYFFIKLGQSAKKEIVYHHKTVTISRMGIVVLFNGQQIQSYFTVIHNNKLSPKELTELNNQYGLSFSFD